MRSYVKKYEYSWAHSNGIKAIKYQSHFTVQFGISIIDCKIVDCYTSKLVSILPQLLNHNWNNKMKLLVLLLTVLALFELHRAESATGKLIIKAWWCLAHHTVRIMSWLLYVYNAQSSNVFVFRLILKACESWGDCTDDNFAHCVGAAEYKNGTIVNGKCRKNFILSIHKMFVYEFNIVKKL